MSFNEFGEWEHEIEARFGSDEDEEANADEIVEGNLEDEPEPEDEDVIASVEEVEVDAIEVEPIGESGFHLGLGLYFGLDGYTHGMWRGAAPVGGGKRRGVLGETTAPGSPQFARQPAPRGGGGRDRCVAGRSASAEFCRALA